MLVQLFVLTSSSLFLLKGSVKLATALAYRKELKEMFDEMDNLCETISESGRLSRRYKLFDKYVNICQLINNSYHTTWSIGCLIACAYPGVMYYFTKQVVFPFSCYIPFLDPFAATGYTMTMIFQFICVVIAYNGTIGFDTFFIFGVVQGALRVDIFRLQIEELNELLIAHKDEDQNLEYHDKVKMSLHSIIKAHQAISNGVSRMGQFFYWSIAVQVGLSVVSMAISLFMTLKVLVKFVNCHKIFVEFYFNSRPHGMSPTPLVLYPFIN
jgi:7tm Odorant receptor